ncbi:hypothetical protein MY9_1250 [Bacillus sp. JS]|nr:hypothetical protein MY9_1250 [Bacillus sp. JS]
MFITGGKTGFNEMHFRMNRAAGSVHSEKNETMAEVRTSL